MSFNCSNICGPVTACRDPAGQLHLPHCKHGPTDRRGKGAVEVEVGAGGGYYQRTIADLPTQTVSKLCKASALPTGSGLANSPTMAKCC